jgi:hypothetical protein
MTKFILFIYIPAVVRYNAVINDWTYAGEYQNKTYCEQAAYQFGMKPELARCVDTGVTNK